MRKFIIVLLLLLCAIAFAKTWEANLEWCGEEYGGFWFPDHKWTDKGEPWIKSFINGEELYDYKDFGISFNFESPYICVGCEMLNPFDIRYLALSKDSAVLMEDSIYFFIACDKKEKYENCDKKLSIENLTIDDFALAKRFGENLLTIDSISFLSLGDVVYHYDRFVSKLYFIYKKYSDKFEYSALCDMIWPSSSMYMIQCEFQDDGSLNFDKLPDVDKVPHPDVFCEMYYQKVLPVVRQPLKNFFANQPSYKINGTPASQGSSNIIIKNNQPTLQLKGEH